MKIRTATIGGIWANAVVVVINIGAMIWQSTLEHHFNARLHAVVAVVAACLMWMLIILLKIND